ncbi:RelA/SpoT domain-containing protein [Pseudomonas luteola]|uniref:RelA/SpoT domain-containing protein n=1 Tax=Pseudomonas luteola TaxID=47886 RepID=A0ABS0MUP8_PSELU|nr:RelA/SpoT domain-containing protein [Pseudomonas luteola]MBH3440442.1 RelA/SpoT domain-containing protein [Pseudomonas luteola]
MKKTISKPAVENRYSKKQVEKAGDILIGSLDIDSEEYNQSMNVLSYWRTAHAPALEITTAMLKRVCEKHDTEALIAKRLKRTPSIISKLRRHEGMKLRNMQDIGGCRAVIKNTKTLHRIYKEINRGGELHYKNYISSPKDDGYRGIHIVCPVNIDQTSYKIEIQLRSRTQHAWSTAVEIVDLFTNQNLKSNDGKYQWKEFFKATSIELEKLESGTELFSCENLKSFITLYRSMKIKEKFEEFSKLINELHPTMHLAQAGGYNLLVLRRDTKELQITHFTEKQLNIATANYLTLEKEVKKKRTVAALISVDSAHNLQQAYPNYFADSQHFISLLQRIELAADALYPKNVFYRILAAAGFGKVSEREMKNKIKSSPLRTKEA